MEVQAFESAEAFLAVTEDLRSRQPVLTNVIGAVATSVASGRTYDRELWLTVRDGDSIVGCAIRTAPWPAALSPMPVDAAAAVGRYLAAHEPDVGVVTGPAEAAQAAVAAMGRTSELRMRDIARVLGTLAEAPKVGGAFRATTKKDVTLLATWFLEFAEEAGLAVSGDDEAAEAARLAVNEGRLFVWEDTEGTAVAMGGNAVPVATPGGAVARIGPIYTPVDHRRNGYGSAITHAVATRLLDECDTVMLFADAANRDSNSIYEQLGFAAVAEIVELELT